MATVAVWVLVVGLGSPGAFPVPGIASQRFCNDLGKAIVAADPAVTVHCFKYRVPSGNHLTAE